MKIGAANELLEQALTIGWFSKWIVSNDKQTCSAGIIHD